MRVVEGEWASERGKGLAGHLVGVAHHEATIPQVRNTNLWYCCLMMGPASRLYAWQMGERGEERRAARSMGVGASLSCSSSPPWLCISAQAQVDMGSVMERLYALFSHIFSGQLDRQGLCEA